MSQKNLISMFAFASAALALGATACTAPMEEEQAASADAVTSGNACTLPGGTDAPDAKAPRCAVVAPAGVRLRKTPAAAAVSVHPDGWGGLPCGWDLSLASTSIGDKVSTCSLWGEVDGRAAGKAVHGFVNATYLACQLGDERDDEFEARVTRACGAGYGVGDPGAPTYAPSQCAPDAGWRKVATHAIALEGGEGRDAASISTAAGTKARVAAIFSTSAGSRYLGCFKALVSGDYGGAAASQGTYAIGTNSPFHATSGGTTTYASSATVDYYLVSGDAVVQ